MLVFVQTVTYGMCTDCSLFAKFSSPIAFTCMVYQNFPHQILPVYGTVHVLCALALKAVLTMWHGKCLSQSNSIPLYHLLGPIST